MQSIQPVLATINAWLNWLPAPIVSVLIVTLAAAIALALHNGLRTVARDLLQRRAPSLLSILTELRGLTRLAILILAMVIALPVAPIPSETAELLARLLLMAVVCLVGWTAIKALNIGANIYLRRFRLDVDDNLLARKHNTQVRVLLRTLDALLVLITIGAALMTFPAVRQYGYSLFASAGVAGIIAGLAARPVLTNLLAGVQLAMTQPIRMDDIVIVEGEWGVIEEITSTYVVVRIWDLRRMIVPLSYFIEKPFQNWTRESSALIGTAFFYLDYRAPVAIIRDKLGDIVKQSKNWNGKVVALQVTDTRETVIEVRALMSANDAGRAFDLRCEVREQMIDFLQREHPAALPRQRADVAVLADTEAAAQPAGKAAGRRGRAGRHGGRCAAGTQSRRRHGTRLAKVRPAAACFGLARDQPCWLSGLTPTPVLLSAARSGYGAHQLISVVPRVAGHRWPSKNDSAGTKGGRHGARLFHSAFPIHRIGYSCTCRAEARGLSLRH